MMNAEGPLADEEKSAGVKAVEKFVSAGPVSMLISVSLPPIEPLPLRRTTLSACDSAPPKHAIAIAARPVHFMM
jgi:hypothetical protein